MQEPFLPPTFERSLHQVAALASAPSSAHDLASLREGLVLQSIDALNAPATPDGLAKYIHDTLNIVLSVEDIVKTVGTLASKGIVAPGEGEHSVTLPPSTKERLHALGGEASTIKTRVVQEWLDGIDAERAQNGLPPLQNLDQVYLRGDLETFLLQLVRYHGAEIVSFLYPDDSHHREILEIDERALFLELPPRGDTLNAIRHQHLPAFVREATGDRATYIADLLHRATILQVLQADASASALLVELNAPKQFYLDTNVVFRLLGLQGDVLCDAARCLLTFGREQGHEFLISTKTYSELENLVKRQADWLAEGPDISSLLSELAAEHVAGNDYVSAYWRDRATRGVTVERFRSAYSQLRLKLENLGIAVSGTLVAELAKTADLRTAVVGLRELKPLDPDLLVEHDAFHKVLIEALRLRAAGLEPHGWYEATHVFTTCDNKLPVYAARMATRGKGHRVPYCIMANELLQLLSFTRPNSSIPAQAFVALINSPYLQAYFSGRAVDRDLVREIAWTLEELREFRPEVGRKVLADRTLTNRLEAMKNQKERRKAIVEAVELAAEASARAHERALAEKDAEVVLLKQQLRARGPAGPTASAPPAKEKRGRSRSESKPQASGGQIQSLKAELSKLTSQRRKDVERLENDINDLKRKAERESSLLAAFPIILLVIGIGMLASGGAHSPIGWVATILAFSTIAAGILSRFRGGLWRFCERLAAIVTVVVAVWDHVPIIRTTARMILDAIRHRN